MFFNEEYINKCSNGAGEKVGEVAMKGSKHLENATRVAVKESLKTLNTVGKVAAAIAMIVILSDPWPDPWPMIDTYPDMEKF